MDSNENNGARSRLLWALSTPFLLACCLIALPLVPALCVFLDSRSRTYTGAVTVVLGSGALSLLLGPAFAAVFAAVCITTAAAYALVRTRVPFQYGLMGSAGGGVLGAVALLGILGAALGKPLNEAAAGALCNWLKQASTTWPAAWTNQGLPDLLSIFAAYFNQNGQAGSAGAFSLLVSIPPEILKMSADDKINIVRPVFEQLFSAYIPAWALAGGMIMGGVGYYLPALAQARLGGKPAEGTPEPVAVPPFHAAKFPRYIVVSILLLQLFSYFGLESGAMLTIYVAANAVMTLLMTIQSLALFSFFLTRKGVPTILQVLILAVVAALFAWWLLEFVGIFDVLLDLRAVALRVEAVRAKGKQVFTQSGLDELRKMGGTKKNDKNGKDGEDGKK